MNILRHLSLIIALCLYSSLAIGTDFQWSDDQGKQHQLSELQGAPVVLHLWASWCFPCRVEMPEMAAWLKKNPDIRVLPISLDKSAEDAQHFLQSIGMHTPLLRTTVKQLYALGSRGLPTTIVIAANGDILSVHPGVQQWNDRMKRQLTPLFKAKAG